MGMILNDTMAQSGRAVNPLLTYLSIVASAVYYDYLGLVADLLGSRYNLDHRCSSSRAVLCTQLFRFHFTNCATYSTSALCHNRNDSVHKTIPPFSIRRHPACDLAASFGRIEGVFSRDG
ncbi:hypothetical protein GGR55DRAFT_663720 [Xylaria sp. FL0064]|nr:hypothetical protein GGR55DRAFT_663720 [Xylaria sp. FL0064]